MRYTEVPTLYALYNYSLASYYHLIPISTCITQFISLIEGEIYRSIRCADAFLAKYIYSQYWAGYNSDILSHTRELLSTILTAIYVFEVI